MKKLRKFIPVSIFLGLVSAGLNFVLYTPQNEDLILSYIVDTKKQELKLYWKNEKGIVLNNFENLKKAVERGEKKLLFAMNGGMYMEDYTPLGLYIENGKKIRALNTKNASGNFYMKPNGVFYLSKDRNAFVCKTEEFKEGNVSYATQSGPMLVINGKIHGDFKEGSANLNIRNGVGILPDNRVLFAMSKKPINFYDFAKYFRDQGCKNALYLDGFVSRTYLPEKDWVQTGGTFGVMIAVTN